jgi:hypothetical protein
MGYIKADAVLRMASTMGKNQYGLYLRRMIEEEVPPAISPEDEDGPSRTVLHVDPIK